MVLPTYHLSIGPTRVHGKRCQRTKSSMILFKERHRWKKMAWFARSSPTFLSNLGISGGSLVSMEGQVGSCVIGSLHNLHK